MYTTIHKEELLASVQTSLIDQDYYSRPDLELQLLQNDPLQGKKVLVALEEELKNCDSFCFSTAFITMSGLTPLLQVFKELEEKGIPGKILTTDYLCFSDPSALERLSNLKNIEVKLYHVQPNAPGFHTKGYIFKRGNQVRAIIGSSNLTQSALTVNKEWNTRLVALETGSLSASLLFEFNTYWNSEMSFKYDEFKNFYQEEFKNYHKTFNSTLPHTDTKTIVQKLEPNTMQHAFIKNLKKLIDHGQKRALLISSTGTGKTFAAAFAMRELHFQRILFLVHRDVIVEQALNSFQVVLKEERTYGKLTSKHRSSRADYVFSTIQFVSKDDVLSNLDPREFDAIIIDEVHRAGAYSYQKIIHYFEPKLLLGMTATPERRDNYDLYALFDHNIAYEIRLKQALKENLLCPFHYFGITDFLVDGNLYEKEDLRNFNYLIQEDRVNYIIEKIQYYGYSGPRPKGLIFVSRKEEAKELSNRFNQKGFHTTYLTGEDSSQIREQAIARLAQNEKENSLDYIFTVEIFNEGVDIPSINQIIMLRPTESPIIFIQQLGRGLRKYKEKEYVVILDFIGNYQSNYMIPIALSSDRTYNKDTIRHFVLEGDRLLPGSSTIHFDRISREKIFESIDQAKLQTTKLIRDSYLQLKQMLGRIPTLMDFEEFGEIEPSKILQKFGSYPAYLQKYEKEYPLSFSKEQLKILEYISKRFASGKRIHELLLLKELLSKKKPSFAHFASCLKEGYGLDLDHSGTINLVNQFTNNYITGTGKDTYKDCIFLKEEGNDYTISSHFDSLLKNKDFKESIEEVIEYGIYLYKTKYLHSSDNSPFVLYAKYTYDDVGRLLNWEKGEVALNIGGYKYDEQTKTYPIYINYVKEETISETTKYEDRFISPSLLKAISKQGRTPDSSDVSIALQAKEKNVNMYLFVRKNKDDKESKEFYYLGRIFATGHYKTVTVGGKSAVEIEYELEHPVRSDIYDYITN
ncbi:DUF3427 domain-containing protein [Dubosiella newyorkensis]|uniref:DUF3427 domain-containing protein n=1 Tax=Dubosiella newyorkensis TaxID=1862672 RepID=UPI00248CFE94|nr:DEAD/DEAH box helicase [Dubosiella newyorkensis]